MNDITQGISEQFSYGKYRIPMIGAAILAPLFEVCKEFIFNDWKFLASLTVLITLDTVTGFAKAWKRGVVSSQGFTGVLLKVFVYGSFVIVLHVLGHFSDKEAVKIAFDWVGTFGYAAVLVRESISIIENLGTLKEGLIPEWILKRLKDFDEDGKVDSGI